MKKVDGITVFKNWDEAISILSRVTRYGHERVGIIAILLAFNLIAFENEEDEKANW